MNLQIYERFISNNKKLVNAYNKRCTRDVIKHCSGIKSPTDWLFHGTSRENAASILKNGFEIDRFSGTKGMGAGVYLTPDENLTKIFGNQTLRVKVGLKSPVHFTFEALSGFKKVKNEFFDEILAIIAANRRAYLCDDTEFDRKLLKKLQEKDIDLLAKVKKMSVEKCAENGVLCEGAATIHNNMFTDCFEALGKTSLHTYDDIYGGIMGRPMHQWVVDDVGEILDVVI